MTKRDYLSRKEEGRELTSIEDREDIKIKGHEELKKIADSVVSTFSNSNSNIRPNSKTTESRKQKMG